MAIELPDDFSKQVSRELKSVFLRRAREEAQRIKKALIQDLLSHPITQEIQAGPNANGSNFLVGVEGNLFGFIGFEEGSDPIAPILELFNGIDAFFTGYIKDGIRTLITIPEPADVWSVTPMPAQVGRSWARGIELGISGLNYYLFKDAFQSRSGAGIQSKKRVRGGVRFENTPYISAMLRKYKRELNVRG